MLPLFLFLLHVTYAHWLDELDLPDHHIPYFLHGNAELRMRCMGDDRRRCHHQDTIRSKDLCWGYEAKCLFQNSFSSNVIQCGSESDENLQTFWRQVDFGYLRTKRQTMKQLCASSVLSDKSSLICTGDLTFCKADAFILDLSTFNATISPPHRRDILSFGDIQLKCEELLDYANEPRQPSAFLADWVDELRAAVATPLGAWDKPCDLSIDKSVLIVKPDSWYNLYHHVCDFLNLYLTQHLNGSFDRDVQIVFWDTTDYGYQDTLFNNGWTVFSQHPPIQLISLAGKRVCFKSAVFALPPRMLHGLYYQTPMVDDCQRSGLLRAFADHFLHRLKIKRSRTNRKLKITLLLRKTGWRNLNNSDEIAALLKTRNDADVEVVSFNKGSKSLEEQLQLIQNTDLLVGMHGAGLTHLLFLPPWAALLEIFDCNDGCYRDLARMKGVYYSTLAHDKVSVVQQVNSLTIRPYTFDLLGNLRKTPRVRTG
uniref:EGF domain-specific O-linked N-acetylglucosamine transferase n=1 Tax=Plectus sambesii TaxID=2011161 RepID=A0A914XRD1_9BILA